MSDRRTYDVLVVGGGAIGLCCAWRASQRGASVVVLDRGVFLFPDTNAHQRGEKPQHLYSVRFAAREIWGDQASPRDLIHLDMWDDYLERV